jgi:hypothetical protein
MNFFVAVTDYDWFQLHASKSRLDEVNFWRPSPEASFKALSPGQMLLFKLHSPRNFIVGGGFFTRFIQLPLSLSWEVFGEGNGVRSLLEMRDRIAKYRRVPIEPTENRRSVAYSWPNHSFSEMRNGFQYLWISASTLSKERATTAKTEPAAGPSGKRSPKDWRHVPLRTLTRPGDYSSSRECPLRRTRARSTATWPRHIQSDCDRRL